MRSMAGLIERRGFAKIVTGRGGANLKGRVNLEVLFLIDFGVGVLFMVEGADQLVFLTKTFSVSNRDPNSKIYARKGS